jgi:hypothetical protein
MFGLPKEIAGTIVAAIIAAGISLLGLIISKENKVSEFRQAWIDSLRAEIAAVIAHAHSVHGACLAKFPDNSVLWQNVREDFVELNEAWAKIKLRLNSKEEWSRAVIRALEEHEGLFPDDGTAPDFSKLKLADGKLLESTQTVLKEEWRRVKRGEFFYRAATVFAGLMVVAGVCLLFSSYIPTARTSHIVQGSSITAIFFDDDGTPDIGRDVGDAFAAEPACKGLSLFRWEGHTAAERLGFFRLNENHWSLTYIPSEGHASASVNLGGASPIFTDGKDAADVMRKVCKIIKGSGGTTL